MIWFWMCEAAQNISWSNEAEAEAIHRWIFFLSSAIWTLFNFHFHKSDSIFIFVLNRISSISCSLCSIQYIGLKIAWLNSTKEKCLRGLHNFFVRSLSPKRFRWGEKINKRILKPRDVITAQANTAKHSVFFYIINIIIRRNWNQSMFPIVCFSLSLSWHLSFYRVLINVYMRVFYYVLLDGKIKFSVWNQRVFQTRANKRGKRRRTTTTTANTPFKMFAVYKLRTRFLFI